MVTSIATTFLHGFEDPEAGGTTGKDPGSLKSINRKHSRTECKNGLEMSILRGVFEGEINSDCIFTRFLLPVTGILGDSGE